MKFFRRNWALLLAAALIPFVVLLAYLQQDWIRQMGDRERTRLRQGLFVAAGELASAFQRELLLAPLAIAPPASGEAPLSPGRSDPYDTALATSNWNFFAERWGAWKSYAIDPAIVAAVHLVRHRTGNPPAILTWNGSAFVAERDSRLSASIEATLDAEDGARSPDSGLLRVGDEEWDIVPIPESRGLLLVIRYDLGEIAKTVLPRLADLHLGAMADYRFRIVDRETGLVLYRTDPRSGDAGFDQPDLRTGLFRKNFGAFDGLGGLQVPESANQGRSGGRDRDAQIAALFDHLLGESAWTLEAVHRNGSLASVVRASTIRNLLLSSGILIMLAAALVALALSNRRAQALAARQEEFVASVTHELKTPLAVIGSAAANMADGIVKEREATMRYGSTIAGETRRLAAMIDKILLYTRLGATKDAGVEEVDLGTLAADALAERGAELEGLGFRVEKALPREAVYVRGDASALRLVIANLVGNVLVHAASGAYLGLFVSKEPRGRGRHRSEVAVLRVDDRGPGIPRRERKAVFEPFYRGRLAREHQEPGSGIGLNLVRRVVLAHGGSVGLESSENFGTSVLVSLPLAEKGSGHGKA